MKPMRLIPILLIITSFSCNQEEIETNDIQRDKILNYFEWLRSTYDTEVYKIDSLERSIDFSKIDVYSLKTTEDLIIADLIHSNDTYLKKSKLILFVNTNEIVRAFIVEFVDQLEFNHYDKFIVSMLNFDENTFQYTGAVEIKTILGNALLSNKYVDGKLKSNGVARKALSKSAQGKAEACIDWYMVTTYYYANGNTRTEEVYLFTTCDEGCGIAGAKVNCGGGAQSVSEFPPNPQNGDEYETTNRDGVYTKYFWDSTQNIWRVFVRILPAFLVQELPNEYPELQNQTPVHGQQVFTGDNMIYTYNGYSGHWIGEASVEIAPAIDKIIADIIEYLNCFDRNSSAQLRVFVDEPCTNPL